MTERLAKVAEVLAEHRFSEVDPVCSCGWKWPHREWLKAHYTTDDELWRILPLQPEARRAAHEAHVAGALAPLLDEFQAEDEARGAARLREAVEALAEAMRTWEFITPQGAAGALLDALYTAEKEER